MKEQIAALGVLVDPNASPDDKAAAAETLAAYLNAQLDAEQAKAEGASEAGTDVEKPEGDSGAEQGDEKKDEPSKEMTSAIATIRALTERVGKLEKASALGNAKRSGPTAPIPRVAPVAQEDPTLLMIKEAAANTRRNASK